MNPSIVSPRPVATLFLSALIVLSTPVASFATLCVAPDNGGGSATLPNAMPTGGCPIGYLPVSGMFHIVDGLPGGTTIDIDVEHTDFSCVGGGPICSFATTPGDCNDPGGTLSGGMGCVDTVLHTVMTGTGTLSGFSRNINVPIGIEHHFAPRTPFAAIQSFNTDLFRLFGQITNPGAGDPDFDLLRFVAGTDFGLPSPGHTVLGQDSGSWDVDSYFDITYRIDFVGRPGGAVSGMSGSTTGTVRLQLGNTIATTTTTTSTTTTTLPAVYDHLECFKAKGSIRVSGVVDLPTLSGTPYDAAGCTIGSVKKYCKPAQKIVISSTPPAVPMPGPNLTSDYICYKIKCPKVSLTEGATDQFGTHALTKMKQSELCVPATP